MTTTLAPRSQRLQSMDSGTVAESEARLRRAYFGCSSAHGRWGVSVSDVVEFASGASKRRGVQPHEWVEDLIVACACRRGEQDAWHHLELAHSWRLREAARVRLSAPAAAVVVAQFWAHLKRNTRVGSGDPSLAKYAGETVLARWLVARLNARLEMPDATDPACLDRAQRVRTLPKDACGFARVPSAT